MMPLIDLAVVGLILSAALLLQAATVAVLVACLAALTERKNKQCDRCKG